MKNIIINFFFSKIFVIPMAKNRKKPKEGRYSQCSAILAFKGTILETGTKFKKTQTIEKNIILERLNIVKVNIPMNINKTRETKTGGSKKEVTKGMRRSIWRLRGRKSNPR